VKVLSKMGTEGEVLKKLTIKGRKYYEVWTEKTARSPAMIRHWRAGNCCILDKSAIKAREAAIEVDPGGLKIGELYVNVNKRNRKATGIVARLHKIIEKNGRTIAILFDEDRQRIKEWATSNLSRAAPKIAQVEIPNDMPYGLPAFPTIPGNALAWMENKNQ